MGCLFETRPAANGYLRPYVALTERFRRQRSRIQLRPANPGSCLLTRLHTLFARCALSCAVLGLAGSVALAAGKANVADLIEQATWQIRIDPETSKRDAEAAIEALRREPDPDLEVQARLILCDYYWERDHAAADREAELASALLPQVHRRGLAAGVLTCRGEIAATVGENTRARDLFDQSVTVATAALDDEMLAETLFSRGSLFATEGKYANGLADLRKSQSLFEKLQMPHYALTVVSSIASLFNRMGDYTQAQHMYEDALKQQRAAGLRREQVVTLCNLGRTHENLSEWDGAREAFSRAWDLSRELGYVRGEAYALRGLAVAANAKNDPMYALETLQRAADLQQQTPDARLDAQIQLARGVALHKLRRLPESLDALEHALAIFRNTDSLLELGETYDELALVNADLGNWRAAYDNQTQSQSTVETLLRNQSDQRFATLKVEFDTAAKEKENQLLLRENEVNAKAIAEGTRARKLQAAVITMIALLTTLLVALAVHQRSTTRRMRKLAMTDELTGVPNRRAVLARIAPLLQEEEPPLCSILVVDIDHFKSINDKFGHPVGDEALRLVSTELSSTLREPAFMGRLGGEEFVVVLPDTGLEAATQTAERLRERVLAIDTHRLLNDRQLTVSIGVTTSLANGDTISSMLKRADSALYEAKYAGRNCVRSEPAALTQGLDSRVA